MPPLIVHVRVLSGSAGNRGGFVAQTSELVRFQVLRILKGTTANNEVAIPGVIEEADDPNDHPVPYAFIRPGGRRGNCYALAYRVRSEYLLFLNRTLSNSATPGWTPYWAPLTPTNEQVHGDTDPWMDWVRRQIK